MTARNILERLHNDGLDVSIAGEDLRIVATLAPPATDLLNALRTHKDEILSLLRSCPTYDREAQLILTAWNCAQTKDTRRRVMRRAHLLRNEDGIPHHIALCLAIESEQGDFNPRLKLQASATEGIRRE